MTVHHAAVTGRTATAAELADEAARIGHAKTGRHLHVAEPERAALRPIEALVASYRHIQSKYGRVAAGKPGRSR
jgi:hypothetical protein